jgi:ADP-heptose:LPS heptosyltransferase
MTRILVFRIGHLGDTLLSLPALRAIRAAHRDASLVLLTNRDTSRATVTAWDVLEPARIFDDVLFFPVPSRTSDFVTLARSIRRLKPSRVYYLPPLPRTRAQTARDWLFFRVGCGIDDLVGLESTGPHPVRDANGALVRMQKESDRLVDWIAPALPAAAIDRRATRLEPAEGDRLRADQILREAGLHGSRLVAIGPGSKSQATQWPVDRYEEAVRRLLRVHPDLRVVVLGAPHERALAGSLCRAWGASAVNLAGSVTLAQTAALLERCVLYVGNDTGTMHLAASVGTPCVAIFSARDNPGRWEPVGDGHVVLRREVPCAGCLLSTCVEQDQACLKAIAVEDVVAAVTAQLTARECVGA